tara:strand:+ start:2716 stop:4140 length:1425 start_codon:yes stop_codon:yes gene_type:complete
MSEVKVNKISPRTNCGTTTLGDSGDTFNVPCGSKINVASGGNITIASGATITNNGTQTGFGRTGAVNWETTPKTANFTAANGEGYFVNTTSGPITITLPAGSAGDIVAFKDYAGTWDTNIVTVSADGTDKISGDTTDAALNTEDQSVTLVFTDSTRGWLPVNDSTSSVVAAKYVTATGGTVTTSGNFKIHTFTGPGTFCVSCAGNSAGSNKVDYLVVAGGGSGGGRYGGGGGGGGYRESSGQASGCYTTAPNGNGVAGLSVSASPFPITVGGGGTGVPAGPPNAHGNEGSNSVFSTITSAGGGGGSGQVNKTPSKIDGGSGGGGPYFGSACGAAGGVGNTPSVTPAQGTDGGSGNVPNAPYSAGGGGGATEAGEDAPGPASGRGGAGGTSCITASPVGRAGGGGGSGENSAGPFTAGAASPCGSGTAGANSNTNSGNAAVNRGGGSGGAFYPGPSSCSGNGGSGIVVIRYKFQN